MRISACLQTAFLGALVCLFLQASPAAAEATIKLVQAEGVAPKTSDPKPGEALKGGTKDAANPAAAPQEPPVTYNSITLRGLNKVTARSSLIEGPLGTVLRFGNLEMMVLRCWQSPPEEQPENAALLEISEVKPKESPVRIFAGWMFSSSPALSSLQHPVYDITVVSCNRPETAKPQAKPASEPAVQAPGRKPEEEPDPAENPLD